MIEIGLKEYKSIKEFKNQKVGVSCKPCLIFNGDNWSKSEELRRLKNLLVDMFHAEDVNIGANILSILFLICFFLLTGRNYTSSGY